MRKAKGITLIALVVTIIVMLILAGISLAAIGGDNGLIKRAMDAAFIQEMTTVQEAFDMYRMAHYGDSKIPTSGIVQSEAISENGRIYGEIAYYRRWSESENKERPEVDVSDKNCFDKYEGDLLVIPRGVEDLFYLNNEEIGINNNKQYIIDAANSMIYRVSGYKTKDIDVHSLAMYKEVTIGSADVNFEPAEVEGSGDNIKYAGEKYYKDKNGHYVDENGNIVDEADKVLNPYGFEIYTDYRSNNIYKLYNNGDLYGKGVKGTGLNTSAQKMSEINASKFSEFTIPSEVKGCKKVISGNGTVFFIDKDDYLWALGNNTFNKLGLTKEQRVEYTERETVKLNVDNKKVDMCWDLDGVVYVRTTDNCLYSMGGNLRQRESYILGTGTTTELTKFTQVNFENPNKINYIVKCYHGAGKYRLIVCCSDQTYYALGNSAGELCGVKYGDSDYKLFTPIYNGWSYTYDSSKNKYVEKTYNESADIDQDIKKICEEWWYVNILKNDGTLWHSEGRNITQFNVSEIGSDVSDVFSCGDCVFCIKNDGTAWGCTGGTDSIGMGEINVTTPRQIKLPNDLVSSGIKEVFSTGSAIYYLSNDGIVYGASSNINYLNVEVNENKVIKIKDAPQMKSFYNAVKNDKNFFRNTVIFEGKDGKMYSIGNANIIYRNSILEKDWTKVADFKVKKVVVGEHNSLAVIDFDNNLYVCGEDGRILGLGISEESKVPNLRKVDNVSINGKVSDVSFSRGIMNVMLNNGDLYATGLYSDNGTIAWPYDNYPGWTELEDHYTLVKIPLSNVTLITSSEMDRGALSDNKIYTWGANYYNSYVQSSRTPILSKYNDIVDGEEIKKMYVSKPITAILLNNGSIYINGGVNGKIQGYTGVGLGNNKLEDKSSSFDNKKVIDFSFSLNEAIFLTDSGDVYGYGYRKYLGVNDETDVITDEIKKLPIGENGEKISQIVVGKDNAFAITEDGKVFGTGVNTYGVLGRWAGTNRNKPNSRYQTAFEWVECPELEL